MRSKVKSKKKAFERDIFSTGEYIQHFNPDDKRNPFFKIYNRKRQDAIDIINKSVGALNILDVGGGRGRLSLALAQAPLHNVILTDISLDMLEHALKNRGRLNSIKVLNADAHRLPFLDKSFDYVVGLDLFCHLETPEKALYEFHRVLKDQGILILDSTNSNPLWAFFYPRYLGKNPLKWLRIIKFRGVYPGWEAIVKHYPKKQFFSLLQNAGFRIIWNVNYGPRICPKWHLAVTRKIV